MKKPSQAPKLSKPAAYDPAKIEKKWQKKWRSADRAGVGAKSLYTSKEDSTKDKFYVLDMFPYPSGEGLHVGHPKGYIATDVISRMKRMQGKSVLHPMGFDAFGLPAENYAIKTKTHPEAAVKKNVARYKEQLQLLGLDYDWSREVNTTDPAYYRWTQWIFLQLYKKGLAFESNEPVNWCPTDKTVLANEDVENGRCERCGTLVEKKPMRQWVLRITDYAERLLKDLDAKKQPPMPLLIDRVNPHQPGKPLVKREVAHAIVFDPKTKKYLIIRNKKFNWDTVIIGGIENGEDAVETARREVREETGYTDLEFKSVLGGQTEAHYYTKHKGQNRIAYATAIYFELKSDARVPIAEGEDSDNEILWIDEKDFVPGKMVNSELPVWLARLSVNVEFNRKGTDVPLFTEVRGASAFKEGAKNVERDAVAVIVKHWKEDKYIGLKWKTAGWQTIITGGPENGQTAEEGAAMEIMEETGYKNPKFKKHLGKVDANFYHVIKQVNRIGHFDALYFELADGERKELSAEDQTLHEVVWLTKDEMGDFLNSAAQRYIWNTLFLGKPNEFADATQPLLDWPTSIKELQKNWIGKSEGAEIDFPFAKKYKYVLIHGFHSSPSDPLYPWLRKELESKGHTVIIPALPNSQKPTEEEQVAFVLKAADYDENTIIYGHSLGTVVAMKVAEKLNKKIAGLVLAGGFADPEFKDHPRSFSGTFNWKFDVEKIRATCGFITALHDINDIAISEGQAERLGNMLGIEVARIAAQVPHFDGDREPAILETLVPSIKVFTTRPDTLFGVTYVVLAPENQWVQIMMPFIENKAEVEAYILKTQKESEIDRTDATKEKTGVELKGIKAINPANGEEVPVWIADYVLNDYGTGAVMAVPAHDERDYIFAKKFDLAIREVVAGGDISKESFHDAGKLVNSGSFTGKDSESAKKDLTLSVGGRWVTKYKLRDWVFSRQRYWGEPIPLIHCPDCGVVPVPEKDLPVKLPKVKSYEPTGTGESPLAAISSWVNVKCPQCKGKNEKPKYFIFDFDGVLGDTWEALIASKLKMGDGTDRQNVIDVTRAYFSAKPKDSRGHALSPEEMAKKMRWMQTFGKHMSETRFDLFKGFVREVKKIEGAKLAVVSAGSNQYVIPALKKSGLDFSHILAYEDHHSKEEKIEKICKDWNVSVKDVYYFTDSQADVFELENQLDKKKLIGCAWGYSGFDSLKEVLPENQILKDFKDIHRFFKSAGMARRETNTMPQWAGSCWYHLRFMDPKNKKAFADPKKEKYWAPVDLYVGGAEHATRHLIYARFWHKVLFDLGYVSTPEPFIKLQSVGLIMGEDGRKMGKRFGNVINPDDMVKTFGADALRVYEMFMGPFDQQITWSSDSIVGTRRFIEKVWRLREKVQGENSKDAGIIHKTIKKVTEDIQNLRFNTAVSTLMIAVNELEKLESVSAGSYSKLLQLMAPFAPHVADELWASLGNKKSIHISEWPVYDPALAAVSEATIMVQVNGKVRGSFTAAAGAGKDELLKAAKELPEIAKWLEGKPVKKEIVVPGRLVNLVV